MSEAIKRMLRERGEAEHAHQVAKAKAVFDPIRKAFWSGFDFMSACERDELTDTKHAFAEGAVFAHRLAGDRDAREWAWKESIARLRARERLDAL